MALLPLAIDPVGRQLYDPDSRPGTRIQVRALLDTGTGVRSRQAEPPPVYATRARLSEM